MKIKTILKILGLNLICGLFLEVVYGGPVGPPASQPYDSSTVILSSPTLQTGKKFNVSSATVTNLYTNDIILRGVSISTGGAQGPAGAAGSSIYPSTGTGIQLSGIDFGTLSTSRYLRSKTENGSLIIDISSNTTPFPPYPTGGGGGRLTFTSNGLYNSNINFSLNGGGQLQIGNFSTIINPSLLVWKTTTGGAAASITVDSQDVPAYISVHSTGPSNMSTYGTNLYSSPNLSLLGQDVSFYLPENVGSNGQAIVGNGAGVLSFKTVIGGSDKQIQFNDAGNSGTDSIFNYDKSTHFSTLGKKSISGVIFATSTIDTSSFSGKAYFNGNVVMNGNLSMLGGSATIVSGTFASISSLNNTLTHITATDMTISSMTSSSYAKFNKGINTSTITVTGTSTFEGQAIFKDLVFSSSTNSPSITDCGSSPSLSGGSTDVSGIITTGSGPGYTTCTLNFTQAWPKRPACIVTGNMAYTNLSAVTTTGQLVISANTDITGTDIMYHCFGNP